MFSAMVSLRTICNGFHRGFHDDLEAQANLMGRNFGHEENFRCADRMTSLDMMAPTFPDDILTQLHKYLV